MKNARLFLALLLALAVVTPASAASSATADITIKSGQKVPVAVTTSNAGTEDVDPQGVDWISDNPGCAHTSEVDSRHYYVNSVDGAATPCWAHLYGTVRAESHPTITLNVTVNPDPVAANVVVAVGAPEPK